MKIYNILYHEDNTLTGEFCLYFGGNESLMPIYFVTPHSINLTTVYPLITTDPYHARIYNCCLVS